VTPAISPVHVGRGDDYEQLTPTAVIVWLVAPLFPELDRMHSIFELRERYTHTLFGDQLTFHVLQLSALCTSPRPTTGYDVIVERWARFLVARDDAELDRLAAEDPTMKIAKQTLDELSQDPAIHRMARRRADAVKLYKKDLAACRAEGKREGKRELLLELLGLRFGTVPPHTRARIEAATPERLDAWAKRVLTAASLDEVLAAET